jgi:type 1 glutamine amidotransferase
MKMTRMAWLAATLLLGSLAVAQVPAKKHLLVLGEEKGYRHESVSHAMATIERLGQQTGLWDTTIRTDTEVLTKKKLEFNAKNLNDFDAILMFTGGNLEMDAQQKADFLSFVHDDGKGLVGVHSAAITWVKWPEFVDMLGGDFDEHPWKTFNAPIIVEDPAFHGMQMKDFSRNKVRVLMRLDPCKLDLANPKVHRTDRDFAVTWAKSYGKGRVYYSTLGHPVANWDDPRIQKMYTEAIKWAMGLTSADITPEPAPPTTCK